MKRYKIYIAAAAVLLLVLLVWIISGCSFTKEFLAKLGFDTHDYDGEKIIRTLSPDSPEAQALGAMVCTLSENSPILPVFSGTDAAVEACRDSLLNYMLNNNYAKYTGNIELLDRASEAYPYLKVSVIIPAEEFEDAAYKYFGGKQKVSNKSGKLFIYLDKVNAYTTVSKPVECTFETVTVSLEETVSTYRYTFYCRNGEVKSPEYFALFIKRRDGTCYFKYLRESENAQ